MTYFAVQNEFASVLLALLSVITDLIPNSFAHLIARSKKQTHQR